MFTILHDVEVNLIIFFVLLVPVSVLLFVHCFYFSLFSVHFASYNILHRIKNKLKRRLYKPDSWPLLHSSFSQTSKPAVKNMNLYDIHLFPLFVISLSLHCLNFTTDIHSSHVHCKW